MVLRPAAPCFPCNPAHCVGLPPYFLVLVGSPPSCCQWHLTEWLWLSTVPLAPGEPQRSHWPAKRACACVHALIYRIMCLCTGRGWLLAAALEPFAVQCPLSEPPLPVTARTVRPPLRPPVNTYQRHVPPCRLPVLRSVAVCPLVCAPGRKLSRLRHDGKPWTTGGCMCHSHRITIELREGRGKGCILKSTQNNEGASGFSSFLLPA